MIGFLRSHVVQLFMSLLVLLDAGIVISQIVLEIQSLQSYKGDFMTQLGEAGTILCKLIPHHQNNHPDCSARRTRVKRRTTLPANATYLTYNSTMTEGSVIGMAVCRQLITSHANLPDQQVYASMEEIIGWWTKEFVNRTNFELPANDSDNSNLSNDRLVEIPVSYNSHPAPSRSRGRIPGAQTMHDVSEILHYLSIAITSLFLLILLCNIACLGKRFFHDTNKYFDGAIIVISFLFDLLYVKFVSTTAATMVVLLIWRIIRIINGDTKSQVKNLHPKIESALMMHTQQHYELRIAMQKRARRLMGRKMELTQTEKEMQDKHIAALEEMLRENGIANEVIRKCKPRYKEYTKMQTENALKSIAALTTGFMGGLVGAPSSNIQDVLSRYGGMPQSTSPSNEAVKSVDSFPIRNVNNSKRIPIGKVRFASLDEKSDPNTNAISDFRLPNNKSSMENNRDSRSAGAIICPPTTCVQTGEQSVSAAESSNSLE